MSEPILKGWVWNIPFYPCINGNTRTLKDIFWYDSSNEDEFVKWTEFFQILIPETCIMASPQSIKYIHDNKERIIRNKEYVMVTDYNGNWGLRENLLPVRLRLGE
jgi:hypothetical protein